MTEQATTTEDTPRNALELQCDALQVAYEAVVQELNVFRIFKEHVRKRADKKKKEIEDSGGDIRVKQQRIEESSEIRLNEYLGTIYDKFEQALSEARNVTFEIKAVIDKQGATAEDLSRGWHNYTELKTRTIPGLAMELLALLGGVYLQDLQFDVVNVTQPDRSDLEWEADQQGSTLPRLLVAEQAKALLSEIVGQTKQIFIVGEERTGVRGCDMLRVRFPAFDIWTLPFIVHEYGYWVASNLSGVKIAGFAKLRTQVEDAVSDPDDFLPKDHPARLCFLNEVIALWDGYEEAEKKGVAASFLAACERKLVQLKEQQLNFLDRLFADAFAALHAGPAYVFALLHLRFVLDESRFEANRDMPPFSHRFVFALEALEWLNTNPRFLDLVKSRRSVADAVSELRSRWQSLIVLDGAKDSYEEIKINYDPWLTTIRKGLIDTRGDWILNMINAWQEAAELDPVLADPGPKDEQLRKLTNDKCIRLATINAAWWLRMMSRKKTDKDGVKADLADIERNVIHILSDPERFIKPPAPSGGRKVSGQIGPGEAERARLQAEQAEREKRRQANIDLVSGALWDETTARRLFDNMVEEKRFTKKPEILTELSGTTVKAARQAYIALYQEDAG